MIYLKDWVRKAFFIQTLSDNLNSSYFHYRDSQSRIRQRKLEPCTSNYLRDKLTIINKHQKKG